MGPAGPVGPAGPAAKLPDSAKAILAPWRAKLQAQPADAKIAVLGDSTVAKQQAGYYLHRALEQMMVPGKPLAGMNASNLLDFGYNGADVANVTSTDHLAALTAARPDVVVFSAGINDIRKREIPLPEMRTILLNGLDRVRAAVPNVPIIAVIPNTFLTADVDNNGYLTPADAAQQKSTTIRQAYLSLSGQWPDVFVDDQQEFVFGVTSRASSPYMNDQIHPSPAGSQERAVRLGTLLAI